MTVYFVVQVVYPTRSILLSLVVVPVVRSLPGHTAGARGLWPRGRYLGTNPVRGQGQYAHFLQDTDLYSQFDRGMSQ